MKEPSTQFGIFPGIVLLKPQMYLHQDLSASTSRCLAHDFDVPRGLDKLLVDLKPHRVYQTSLKSLFQLMKL